MTVTPIESTKSAESSEFIPAPKLLFALEMKMNMGKKDHHHHHHYHDHRHHHLRSSNVMTVVVVVLLLIFTCQISQANGASQPWDHEGKCR